MKSVHDEMQALLTNYLAEGIHVERKRLYKAVEQTIDELVIPEQMDPVQIKNLIKKEVLAEIKFEERGKR